MVSEGIEWRRCATCTTAQPYNPLADNRCRVRLGNRVCAGTTSPLDPVSDVVFRSRKGHLRRHWERLTAEHDYSPHPYVAAEHSAALNVATVVIEPGRGIAQAIVISGMEARSANSPGRSRSTRSRRTRRTSKTFSPMHTQDRSCS